MANKYFPDAMFSNQQEANWKNMYYNAMVGYGFRPYIIGGRMI
jgi:hypothetical protein